MGTEIRKNLIPDPDSDGKKATDPGSATPFNIINIICDLYKSLTILNKFIQSFFVYNIIYQSVTSLKYLKLFKIFARQQRVSTSYWNACRVSSTACERWERTSYTSLHRRRTILKRSTGRHHIVHVSAAQQLATDWNAQATRVCTEKGQF
jgi:hypothetical protein